MAKTWSEKVTGRISEIVPEQLGGAPREDRLTRLARAVGVITLTVIAVGMIANLPDIRRYVRMTMM